VRGNPHAAFDVAGAGNVGRDGVTLADERARQQGTQTSTYTGAPVLDPTCERPVPRQSAVTARPPLSRGHGNEASLTAAFLERTTCRPVDNGAVLSAVSLVYRFDVQRPRPRQLEGATPIIFLKARLKAASDS
jgi:hypothetical protein